MQLELADAGGERDLGTQRDGEAAYVVLLVGIGTDPGVVEVGGATGAGGVQDEDEPLPGAGQSRWAICTVTLVRANTS